MIAAAKPNAIGLLKRGSQRHISLTRLSLRLFQSYTKAARMMGVTGNRLPCPVHKMHAGTAVGRPMRPVRDAI